MSMKNYLFFLLILLGQTLSHAQDIKFNVNVISPQVQLTDKSIFNALQNAIVEFLNTRRWSKDKIMQEEVIECNMIIEITDYNPASNTFRVDLQIQSLRPVFGSSYTTMTANLREQKVTFEYQQFQAMDFQEGNNVYNLTGILAFYAYIIMGMDYDSFGELAGTPYYQSAKAILDASQSIPGWRPNDGSANQNRFYLVDNLLSDRQRALRETLYMYHRKGLDLMHKDVNKGRLGVEEALKNIQELCRLLPNSMIVRNFFLVKHKEIIDIYKEAPVAEKNRMIEMLKKMDVANSSEYEKIRKS